MFDLRLGGRSDLGSALALPVAAASDSNFGTVLAGGDLVSAELSEISTFLCEVEHSGAAGTVRELPRPGRTPRVILLVGVGSGEPSAWRSAGAAVTRAAGRHSAISMALPKDIRPDCLASLAEGLWLADYRYQLTEPDSDADKRLERVTLIVGDGGASPNTQELEAALARTRVVVAGVSLARDLTNTPSDRKCPNWLAGQFVSEAAEVPGLAVEVWDEQRLAAAGFGAVLAVGRGSVNPPRLVRLSWNPPAAVKRVVLVGKGITFDTGGINLKPRDSMKLMRKDMGAAATVVAATWCAARLQLPVSLTTLVPLAENAVGGDALRPGDVLLHRGGLTTEVLNTDAEGRLVLADTLAYASETEQPDAVIDLATLTGAQSVALGKKTAALFTESDDLAAALTEAAAVAGESLWRLPLVEDYRPCLTGSIADLANIALDQVDPGAGAVVAALFLREFTGAARSRWAHLDISGPAWSDSASGELAKGATGWGVRTLVNFLDSLT